MGFEIKTIISPPHVSISSPADGFLTNEATILVKGKTEKGAAIKINGQEVLLSSNGFFEKEIALERGVNVLHIEGSKRYSHLLSQYRHVIFDNGKSFGLSEQHSSQSAF